MKHRNPVVVLVFWGVLLLVVAVAHSSDISAQSPNRVGLVVRMGDGSVITRCVEFAEGEISGYDLLMRSGLQVVAAQSGGIGVTICEIGGEGCPANNCFCRCAGSTCTYWSYWRFESGEWSYSSVGAMVRRLGSGDVDGWTWGQGTPPPVVPLAEICAPVVAVTSTIPPSPTPLPTETATRMPTATAVPATHMPQPDDTATVLPSATWTPTFSSTPSPSATPTDSATLQLPTATPATTPLPQAVAALRVTPAASQQHGEQRSNYALFGILVAVLAGAAAMVVLRRKR